MTVHRCGDGPEKSVIIIRISRIALHAEDPDSRVMYYDYSLDGGDSWSKLYLWPEGTGDDITFTVPVTEGEESKLLIRAYNTYELRTEAVKK